MRFFRAFNWGFDGVAVGISWLATRTVRRAAIMFVIYLRRPRLRPQSNSARRRSASSRRSTAATSSSWCSFRPAPRWRAPMRCSSARSISRSKFPASPTAPTSSASPAQPSPTRPIPARSSWCSTHSRSAPRIRSNRRAPSRRELNRRLSKVQDAFVIAVLPPPVSGIGTAGGFRMMIEDRAGRGSAALQQAAVAMMVRASQTPGVAQVFTLFETSTPQVYLDIDRTKAQLLGVNVQDVFNALQVFLGSAYVNDFNLFGRTFRVTAQARDEDRINTADVLKIRVRNSKRRHRAARLVHHGARHFRPVPGAALQSLSRCRARWRRRARLFAGPGDRDHGEARGGDPARRLHHRVDDARLPADPRRQHRDVRLRAGGGVRLPRARRTVRKPDACRSP